MSVFGKKISKATARWYLNYDKEREITKHDLAVVAYEMKYDEGKHDSAREYLNEQAAEYGSFNAVATKGLIYNASGQTMFFETSIDWSGHVGEAEYATEIKNGQWAAFFHHKPPVLPQCSNGAVVYHHIDSYRCQSTRFVLSWLTAWGTSDNTCYAQIPWSTTHLDDYYFDNFYQTMIRYNRHHYTTGVGDFDVELTIGGDSISEWTAIIKRI